MDTSRYLKPLTADIAAILDEGGTPEHIAGKIADALRKAMKDDSLEQLFEGKQKSFLAYEDPERVFILHASVHKPNHVTQAHDHGDSWAIYGCYRGQTRYRRYRREADKAPGVATLEIVRDEVVPEGNVDVVPPGEVHDISNPGDTMAYNIVVRPRPLTQVWRRRYNPETGEYSPFRDRKGE